MTHWSGTRWFIRNAGSVSRETVAPLDTSGATVVFSGQFEGPWSRYDHWHRLPNDAPSRATGGPAVSRETLLASFPLPAPMEGSTVPSFGERRALNMWHCGAPHPLHVRRTANNAARSTTGMYGCYCTDRGAAHQDMEHVRSTQHDRVSRETRRQAQPLASSACLSQVHGTWTLLPFTVSSCVAERPWGASKARRHIRSTQRSHEAGRTAARRKTGEGRQESRTRIGSHRRSEEMPTARSTQRHMRFTQSPTPTTDTASRCFT